MYWNSLNSLFIKIFVAFWILILLLTSVLVLVPKFDGRLLQPLTNNDRMFLSEQKQRIFRFIQQHPDASNQTLIGLAPRTTLQQTYVTDISGRLLNDRAPRKMRQFILDTHGYDNPRKKFNKRKTYLGPILINHNQQNLLLYFSYPNQKESLAFVEWLIDNPGLLLLTALFISTPLCAFLAWHLTYPLRQLQNAATKVAQGDLEAEFPAIRNSDEITQLGESIKQMVVSLKNMLNNQQRLLSDISHELRSPLTRLSLALAINKKQSGETKALQRIELEAERIEQMIAEMLNVSRMQLSQEQKEDIAFDMFLDDIFIDAEFEAKESGKTFHSPELQAFHLNIYPDLAYRAIENVIRNAIKYSAQHIYFAISINQDSVILHISNDGELIPENEVKNIFRPFYRLNEARDRESGGVGLGLSIAENAMFKHGGLIWTENIEDKVVMHLKFPRFSS